MDGPGVRSLRCASHSIKHRMTSVIRERCAERLVRELEEPGALELNPSAWCGHESVAAEAGAISSHQSTDHSCENPPRPDAT